MRRNGLHRETSSFRSFMLFLDTLCYPRGFRLALNVLGRLFILVLSATVLVAVSSKAHASTRVKDIVQFESVRDNMLIGYGLVVGLNGTGDKLNNTAFTEVSLKSFLGRLGISTEGTELKTKNVAAVTVTATLPAYSRSGGRIDVHVSTLGDAKSIQGGVLLATPLMAANGEVFAIAQGPISIGGFQAVGDAQTLSKGVPTTGFISNGAIVEREIDFALNALDSVKLSLHNPDFTTAKNIVAAVDVLAGTTVGNVVDPGTVEIKVPGQFKNKVADFLQQIEMAEVETDQPARVIVDEASGTIVMGEDVRIDTVAVAQGNLTVRVVESPLAAVPGPFTPAEIAVLNRTQIEANEDKDRKLAVVEKGASLKDVVDGLNALGVGPRDLITILQTIKAAGALQAEIATR